MESELICNFKKCRKKLTSLAWTTSCSHIFCFEDGKREFEKCQNCPVCETPLHEKYDIVQVELNPCDQYKAMVLAGLRPEVIMEICSRAASFWSYQVHFEMMKKEYINNKNMEKAAKQKQFYEQALEKIKGELKTNKYQLETTQNEMEAMKKRFDDLMEKFSDKQRQFQKLQIQNEALKRKFLLTSYIKKDEEMNKIPTEIRTCNLNNTIRHPSLAEKRQYFSRFDIQSLPSKSPRGSINGRERRFLNVDLLKNLH